MKLPSLLLSLFLFGGISAAQAHEATGQGHAMKVGPYDKAESQNTEQPADDEMYCEIHDEYHHHHKNGRVTHSHADGKNRHDHRRKRSSVYHGYGEKKHKVNNINLD
ncbi:hypothetical protein [Alteromonas sp. a30]|uniref:hypothetical protein n=1 Tax=Alteromonas sp. a30 TaxID=2730917 RepID=UPI002282B31C|nr:hypothetical protein [Alteromonas sp. a30]MCY7297280.1 hypothetical protein [Alteromonas sp. a30]